MLNKKSRFKILILNGLEWKVFNKSTKSTFINSMYYRNIIALDFSNFYSLLSEDTLLSVMEHAGRIELIII